MVTLQALLVLALFAVLAWTALAWRTFAPWLPSDLDQARRAFAIAGLSPGSRFVDIGAGDGRVLDVAANEFGADAMGVELALPLYLLARARSALARMQGRRGYEIRMGNLFGVDLSGSDVVYVYGTRTSTGPRLARKLDNELAPGAYVISCRYPIDGWMASSVIGDDSVFIYQI